jgi:DNA-binding transcriptional LysR family regulator
VSLPDLGLVAVFVKVVELESFTAAATALGLPKSSVSRSVSQLEESLGVRLLQRTSRTLSLTEAGRAFLERVREPLAGLLDAMNDAAESQREPRGLIRLTAPPDLGSGILAEPITEFVRRHPQIRLELSLTNRMVDLVAERFDLALRATARLDDSTLVARKIVGSIGGFFASREYLQRRGVPRTLADLESHDCVLFRANDGQATFRVNGPKGPEEIEVTGALSADDFGFVRRAIAAGAGIGFIPGEPFGDHDLVRVLPDYSSEGGSLYVVMPSGRHVPIRVTLLRDFLIEKLSRLR